MLAGWWEQLVGMVGKGNSMDPRNFVKLSAEQQRAALSRMTAAQIKTLLAGLVALRKSPGVSGLGFSLGDIGKAIGNVVNFVKDTAQAIVPIAAPIVSFWNPAAGAAIAAGGRVLFGSRDAAQQPAQQGPPQGAPSSTGSGGAGIAILGGLALLALAAA